MQNLREGPVIEPSNQLFLKIVFFFFIICLNNNKVGEFIMSIILR